MYILVRLRGKFVNPEIISNRNQPHNKEKKKTKVVKIISREKTSVNIVEDASEARRKRRVQKALGRKKGLGLEFAPVPLNEIASASKVTRRLTEVKETESNYTDPSASEDLERERAPILNMQNKNGIMP